MTHTAKTRSLLVSGIDGNDYYCLNKQGLRPGQMLVGNSVQSRGFFGSLSSDFRTFTGGESEDITNLVKDGRDAALSRMNAEAKQVGATGVTDVDTKVTFFDGHLEFLATGSAVHSDSCEPFTSSFDAKELYSMLDAGYQPKKYAFGNIAYAMGTGSSLAASWKSFGRGEIPEISNILNHTRHVALQRLIDDAKSVGANAVVGVETDMMRLLGFHEMMMSGTAAHHPLLGTRSPATCALTCDELWSLTKLGLAPVRIVMGTAVYSVGMAGGFKTFFKSMKKGELSELTTLVYDAREHALDMLESEAEAAGADAVLGTDVFVTELDSGILEFMAVGTAVRKVEGLSTHSDVLPAQAVAARRRTFRKSADRLLTGSVQTA